MASRFPWAFGPVAQPARIAVDNTNAMVQEIIVSILITLAAPSRCYSSRLPRYLPS